MGTSSVLLTQSATTRFIFDRIARDWPGDAWHMNAEFIALCIGVHEHDSISKGGEL